MMTVWTTTTTTRTTKHAYCTSKKEITVFFCAIWGLLMIVKNYPIDWLIDWSIIISSNKKILKKIFFDKNENNVFRKIARKRKKENLSRKQNKAKQNETSNPGFLFFCLVQRLKTKQKTENIVVVVVIDPKQQQQQQSIHWIEMIEDNNYDCLLDCLFFLQKNIFFG